MKSAFFPLTNPEYISETDEHGCYRYWTRFRIPVLPAYALLNYTIQGVATKYDGVTGEFGGALCEIESGIVDDEVFVYGLDDLTQRLMPNEPTLVINYLGIRDYKKFFPHFENQLLRERAAQFMEEADKTFDEASWLSFVLMAGAVFESLLVDLTRDKKAPFGGLIKKITKNNFFSDEEISVLNESSKARNLVHAGRFEDVYVSRDKAMSVRLALEQFLRKDWFALKNR